MPNEYAAMNLFGNSPSALFTRFWVLCLIDGATKAGLAPAGRPQLFALAYLANAVADAFQAEAIQRAVLRKDSGPALADVAVELDRLVGLGLCRATRVVGTSAAAVLQAQYFVPTGAARAIEDACKKSEYLQSVHTFHKLVAAGFSDLGVPFLVNATIVEASYSDLAVGKGEIVDLGEFAKSYPTLVALETVENALPKFRDRSSFGVIQTYCRFLAKISPKQAAHFEVA